MYKGLYEIGSNLIQLNLFLLQIRPECTCKLCEIETSEGKDSDGAMDEVSEPEDEGVDLQNLSEDSSDVFNNNIE